MGFLLKDNNIFIFTKLTDIGRKKLSEGKFKPTNFKIGDSEIDYKYFLERGYNIEETFVNAPLDKNPEIKYEIYKTSGETGSYNIDSINVNIKEYNRQIQNQGFFDGNIYDNSLKINENYIKQPHLQFDQSQLSISRNNIILEKTLQYGPINREIENNDYILLSVNNNDFANGIIDPDKPTLYLWYKIIETSGNIDTGLLVTLDRDLPNLNLGASGTGYCYVFSKYNSIENFYYPSDIDLYWESGFFDFTDTKNTSPKDTNVWSMNIVYTDRIAGVRSGFKNNKYYPSSIYNGITTYLSTVDNKIKNVGIIHYTNIHPKNTLGDYIISETFEIIFPLVMWHLNNDNRIGLRLIAGTEIKELFNEETQYYDLVDEYNNIVGKIFTKLKIITIEDQELLFALSYKSNRNYTLPKPITDFNIGYC